MTFFGPKNKKNLKKPLFCKHRCVKSATRRANSRSASVIGSNTDINIQYKLYCIFMSVYYNYKLHISMK